MNHEINFDGLVGPTHNYSGLAYGNVASLKYANQVSNPKEAALQGLNKMQTLAALGLTQALLPPQERPAIWILKNLGFSGKTDAETLEDAYTRDPILLATCSSASSMWTANAATVVPSVDTQDGRVHITPANLVSKFHRAIEPQTTLKALKAIFTNEKQVTIHEPLPATPHFGDEGAANHTRLAEDHLKPGLNLFVFGRYAFKSAMPTPKHFPARQTLEASQATARNHKLNLENVIFAQQNPIAIDAGVFHNDVISVGNENVFLYHEQAFLDTSRVIQEIAGKFSRVSQKAFIPIKVSAQEVTLQEAVYTYLFNSQLVTTGENKMVLIAAKECEDNKVVKRCLEKIVAQGGNPIDDVIYLNLKQSMENGGGPACLRLRVVLTAEEIRHINQRILLTNTLFETLCGWVKKHYRDRLHPNDLRDPQLLTESRCALDELTQILNLGSIYAFQQTAGIE